MAVRLWTRTEKIDSGSKKHSHFCIWARQEHGHVKVRLVPGEGGECRKRRVREKKRRTEVFSCFRVR